MFEKAGKPDVATIKKLAFLGQDTSDCLSEEELDAIKNKNQRENHPQNCAKLNMKVSPYTNMLGGPVALTKTGRFQYFSSRNNNFSNRDQTGTICVGTDCSAYVIGTKTQQAKLTQLASDRIVAVTEADLLDNDLP